MELGKRDLLVLAKKDQLTVASFKWEIAFLTKIIYSEQNTRNFYLATEVIDINHHSVIKKTHLVQQAIKDRSKKPFVFISNKN
jgi:hypothetical protein